MAKLIGYTTMKKYDGKVLFLANDNGAEVGHSCDTLRIYGEKAKIVNPSLVGKDVEVVYGKITRGDKEGQAYIKELKFN